MMPSSDGNVLVSPIKPKLPRKPEGLTLQENREKQRILQEKGKLTPQFKYVKHLFKGLFHFCKLVIAVFLISLKRAD